LNPFRFDKKLARHAQENYMSTKINSLPFASSPIFSIMMESLDNMIQQTESIVSKEILNQISSKKSNGKSTESIIDATSVAFQKDDPGLLQQIIEKRSQKSPFITPPNPLGLRLIEECSLFSDSEGTTSPCISDIKYLASLLLKACHFRALSCLQKLLDLGASIDNVLGDVYERNLIHRLLIGGSSMPLKKIDESKLTKTETPREDDPTLLRVILNHFRDVIPLPALYTADVLGRRPLHYACLQGLPQSTLELLKYMKLDPKFSSCSGLIDRTWWDHDGMTPLYYAIFKGHIEIVDLLLPEHQHIDNLIGSM